MNTCPHKLRADLPPLTARIAALPIDERGYPVPYFVAWIDGRPEFRMADERARQACMRDGLCWVCGQPLGRFLTFVIGPMCVLNRTTAEPPSHKDCAEWSVKGCPFLSRPKMERREDELTAAHEADTPGFAIKRNPGVTALWTTHGYDEFADGRGGRLIQIGHKVEVSWWREGRAATRAEILESIDTGLPILREQCEGEVERERAGAHAELDRRYAEMLGMLP